MNTSKSIECLANYIKRTLKENTKFKIIVPMSWEDGGVRIKVKYRQSFDLYIVISDSTIDVTNHIYDLSDPESLNLALSEALWQIELYCGAVDRSAITETDDVDQFRKEYAESIGETYTTDLEEFLKRHAQDNSDYFDEPVERIEKWEDNGYLMKRPKKNTWASLSGKYGNKYWRIVDEIDDL